MPTAPLLIKSKAGLVRGDETRSGRLPRRGETAVLDGYEFRIVRSDRRRIESLRVTTPESSGLPDEAVAASDSSG